MSDQVSKGTVETASATREDLGNKPVQDEVDEPSDVVGVVDDGIPSVHEAKTNVEATAPEDEKKETSNGVGVRNLNDEEDLMQDEISSNVEDKGVPSANKGRLSDDANTQEDKKKETSDGVEVRNLNDEEDLMQDEISSATEALVVGDKGTSCVYEGKTSRDEATVSEDEKYDASDGGEDEAKILDKEELLQSQEVSSDEEEEEEEEEDFTPHFDSMGARKRRSTKFYATNNAFTSVKMTKPLSKEIYSIIKKFPRVPKKAPHIDDSSKISSLRKNRALEWASGLWN
jgi:hypothetical protein